MLDTNNLGIVVVDMQYYYLKSVEETTRINLIDRICGLLNTYRVPAIAFEMEFKFTNKEQTLTIPRIRELLDSENSKIFKKRDRNGFNSYLDKQSPARFLIERKVSRLLFVGIFANECVLESAEGAIKEGFQIIGCKNLMGTLQIHEQESLQNAYRFFQNFGELYEDSHFNNLDVNKTDLVKRLRTRYSSQNLSNLFWP